MEDLERLRKKLDENRISLNEEVRRHEVDEQKARKEARSKERLARRKKSRAFTASPSKRSTRPSSS